MEYQNYIIYSQGGYIEVLAPSTVEKPTTGLTTGLWTETNTGKVFFYDVANGWTEQFSLQG